MVLKETPSIFNKLSKIKMDKNTLGGSEEAEILEDILSNYDSSLLRCVKRRLDNYRNMLNCISEEQNRKYVANLIKEDFIKTTNDRNWPKEVKTFFNNLVTQDYRNFIKKQE